MSRTARYLLLGAVPMICAIGFVGLFAFGRPLTFADAAALIESKSIEAWRAVMQVSAAAQAWSTACWGHMISAAEMIREKVVSVWDDAIQFVGILRQSLINELNNVAWLFVSVEKASASDSAVLGVRAALVSMGGATFSATAIGVTLTIFFFQQNIQRLQYRTSKSIYRDQRIGNFAASTIGFAIADYFLAAIITPRSAYVICAAGVRRTVWIHNREVL